ncbi:hypothetical protein PLESTM_001921800 [Pleodorina starrii]|nr:hypothetical protein PLESTM_001921800 [Pleodorina starrii]
MADLPAATGKAVVLSTDVGTAPWYLSGLAASPFIDASAQWIWATAGALSDAPTNVIYIFEKSYNAPMTTDATLIGVVDNQCDVFLNGDLQGSLNAGWEGVPLQPVSMTLGRGTNILSLQCVNVYAAWLPTNPAGLIAVLRDSSDNVLVRTDGSWAVNNTGAYSVGPACDMDPAPTLTCYDGMVITSIISAFFGRSDRTTCPYPFGTAPMQKTDCSAPDYAAHVARQGALRPGGRSSSKVSETTGNVAVSPDMADTSSSTGYVSMTSDRGADGGGVDSQVTAIKESKPIPAPASQDKGRMKTAVVAGAVTASVAGVMIIAAVAAAWVVIKKRADAGSGRVQPVVT